jgi:hypothetical protein
MSYERNIKWLNDRRVIYRQDPIDDKPTIETNQYMFYEDGTYQCYHLFNSRAKITTYKSLKWHMLVLYYLNMDNIINSDFVTLARFISNKENGFVTFFIKNKLLESIIGDVLQQGGDPPVNRLRKVIFKWNSGLNLSEKLRIVGQLIGRRSRVWPEDIYQCMEDMHEFGKKITWGRIAGLMDCSERTIHRNMTEDLKQIKKELNEKL